MSNLLLYNPNGIEVVINSKNGKVFATHKGYQKLSDRSLQTINRYCQKRGLRQCESGSILDVVSGEPIAFRSMILMPSHMVLEGLIIHNRSKAVLVGSVGAAVYLYRLAGFNVKISLQLVNNPNKSQG